jgi:cytoskeletal protein CcmA (bactofilin family)
MMLNSLGVLTGAGMRSEQKQIEGDVVLSDELQLYGQVTGSVTVEDGGVLHVFGMVGKSVTVKAGGTATVHGMVSGDVRNEGGGLHIRGMVLGRVTTIPPGKTVIEPAAIVSGGVA